MVCLLKLQLKRKIAAVAATISGSAKETIHLEPGTYVSAGWIDDHVHCFEKWLFIMIIQMKLGSKGCYDSD